jgi:DNA invertase Pin-like site-specific DNA recombinase
VRQSTVHQVHHHLESQRRQWNLSERALELGWTRDRIVEVGEDMGRSASRSGSRSGFEKMVAEAALSKVGIILALEVSRVSRGNRDWYHLLDICSITGTLIADGDGLYDPRNYNDRLLLGLKGTMSEAELYIMKQRLVEAMLAKARRGELQRPLPPGYVWDEAGRMQKDPDAQVRSAIDLVFRRFAELGTIHAVFMSLVEDGVEIPLSGGPRSKLRWSVPVYDALHRLLTHPVYAGAYVYGRRQVEEVLDAEQRPRKRVRWRRRGEWPVLILDHHEGYIGWDVFERNQRQIASNWQGKGVGAPREGVSLLQGLVLCGRCGRRMHVRRDGRHGGSWYVCNKGRKQVGSEVCQAFGATRLERAIESLLLEALAPVGLEAMLESASGLLEARQAEMEHWQQRVERGRYEVDLARRQYDKVDPANRLVAGELERRWEQALRELHAREREAEERTRTLGQPLTAEEKETLRRYSRNLSELWNQSNVRRQDKKRIVRCLIEQVVVHAPRGEEQIGAEVHWIGGEMTPVEVPRAKSGNNRWVMDPELVELITRLSLEFTDEQIARILNRKKLRTAKGLPFTTRRVTSIRGNHDIPGRVSAALKGPDVYTLAEASKLLGVNPTTVALWAEIGLLKGTHLTAGAPWRIQVTEEDRRRLTAADSPPGWLPLKGAAAALRLSQQTVLQRLQSGELKGVRVQVGRRMGWRIHVPTTSYDHQPSLFKQPGS